MKRFSPVAAVLTVLILISSCSADVERWRVIELPFESSTDYTQSGADEVMMDVTFTDQSASQTLTVPAFWDGGNTFRCRFAPVSEGVWKWKSSCPEDSSLDGLSGKFRCGKYKGNLDIYKHGFLKVESGKKYFTYDDGTPFFYLGDTHWGMYTEEIDEPGPHAGATGAASHFCYIVDRRAEQGFTVYQSEPIGSEFKVADGEVDASDIPGFQLADRYYQHIADAGLVHANAEFFFDGEMKTSLTDAQLEKLSRYWVARFGAYPVLWTLAQESDNNFYLDPANPNYYDRITNPWVKVAEYIHRYDAYKHPLSAHQEYCTITSVTGRGTTSEDGVSAFADPEIAERTGHDWWATQWSPSLFETSDSEVISDYCESVYPAVNYEGRYCYLWTKNFGSRAQGWISFLSGFCGYGYGAIDIWLYKSTYDIDHASCDGVDSISVADKAVPWSESVEFESAHQMHYLRDYFESFDWWNLSPVLKGDSGFIPDEDAAWAYAGTEDRKVLYFYGRNTATGTIEGLNPGEKMSLSWYNPRTGETYEAEETAVSENGTLKLPVKPDSEDWVLTCTVLK